MVRYLYRLVPTIQIVAGSNEIEAVVANVVISREKRTALLARSISCSAGLRVWRYGDGSCLAMRLRKVAYVMTRMCNGQCMASK